MKQQLSVVLAAALFAATPALAADPAPGTPYNCDFEPACEVSPGIYGTLQAPATSKFNLSVGGFVKLDYAYNSVNLGPTGYLIPSSGIPKSSSNNGQKDQSIFSVRQSRLWFKANGPALLGAKTTSLLELDFHGNLETVSTTENLNATPRIRQGYANLDWGTTQLLFGQTADAFTGGYSANTVDFSGGSGGNGARNPQIRLTQRVNLSTNNALKLVVALQQPYQSNFLDEGKSGAAGSIGDSWGSTPNVVGQALFISKALGVSPGYFGQSLNNFTTGFYGLYGNQSVRGESNKIASWGAGYYTFIPVLNSKDGKSRAKTLTVEGDVYVAANLAYGPSTSTSYVGKPGDLNPARGYGIRTQALFFPVQDISIAAGYGRRGAINYNDYKNNPNFQKYYQVIYANVNYDLNAAIRVAAEYQHADNSYGNVTSGTGNLAGTAQKGTANIGRLAFFYFF